MNQKSLFQLTIGIFIGLFCSAVILIINNHDTGSAIVLHPVPTLSPIKVYISGEVENPGMYELPRDSRVEDLINLAGGTTIDQSERVNLAAKLYDGQHVHISNEKENTSALSEPSKDNELININEASIELLKTLPGIGEKKAEEIINFRETNGPFETIEAILEVPGIGEYTYDQIKQYLTINSIY